MYMSKIIQFQINIIAFSFSQHKALSNATEESNATLFVAAQ